MNRYLVHYEKTDMTSLELPYIFVRARTYEGAKSVAEKRLGDKRIIAVRRRDFTDMDAKQLVATIGIRNILGIELQLKTYKELALSSKEIENVEKLIKYQEG